MTALHLVVGLAVFAGAALFTAAGWSDRQRGFTVWQRLSDEDCESGDR